MWFLQQVSNGEWCGGGKVLEELLCESLDIEPRGKEGQLIPALFETDTRLNSSLLARNQEKKL